MMKMKTTFQKKIPWILANQDQLFLSEFLRTPLRRITMPSKALASMRFLSKMSTFWSSANIGRIMKTRRLTKIRKMRF